VDEGRRAGLAINAGHGYAKVVLIADGHVQRVTLPALVGQAQPQLTGAIQRIPNVEVGGRAWWVGDDALISRHPLTALNQDRIRDPIFIPALVRSALSRLVSNGMPIEATIRRAVCVTGLPATWSTDKELAGALVHRLKAAAPLGSVRVIAEPLGLLYAALLDNDGEIAGAPELQQGRVAVIDVGHLTVDVAAMDHLVPVPTSLVTYQLGTARPLQVIQQRLSAMFEVELPLYRVDQVVRSGTIRMAGRDEPLPDGWDTPFHAHGQELASRLVEAWGGSGRQFDTVLIGGGGAELPALVAALQARFKHAQVVPDGQLAIALGYARLARRLGNRS
jgi:hypothetical protein